MSCTNFPFMDLKIPLDTKISVPMAIIPARYRKSLKLLEKQFEIIEIYKESDIFIRGDIIAKVSPLIINYRHHGKEEIFTYKVNLQNEKLDKKGKFGKARRIWY